jgi:hypothetical protein
MLISLPDTLYIASVNPHEFWIVTEFMPGGNIAEHPSVGDTQKVIY